MNLQRELESQKVVLDQAANDILQGLPGAEQRAADATEKLSSIRAQMQSVDESRRAASKLAAETHDLCIATSRELVKVSQLAASRGPVAETARQRLRVALAALRGQASE